MDQETKGRQRRRLALGLGVIALTFTASCGKFEVKKFDPVNPVVTPPNPPVADPVDTPAPAPAPTFAECAWQGSWCNFQGTRQVRYGTEGHWVEKTLVGPVYCESHTFGANPAPWVWKRCLLASVG